MNIIINVFDGSHLSLCINQDDTCISLKDKIEKNLGFKPGEQRLFFQNQILEINDKKLIDYGIYDGCTVSFLIYPRKFTIFVGVIENLLEVPVDRNDSLDSVKSAIQSKLNISIGEAVFWYKENILEGNQCLDQYGITDCCIIKMIPKIRTEFTIRGRTLDGRIVSMQVTDQMRISDLKAKIEITEIGLKSINQNLSLYGAMLEDDKTINDYYINEGCIINITEKFRKGITLFIKIHEKLIPIEIIKSQTISDLKKIIEEKLFFCRKHVKLIYGNCTLSDDITIDDCGIADNGVIHVVGQSIEIFVETTNGECISLSMVNSENIENLKKQIEKKMRLAPDEQRLIFKGVLVDDDSKTISEYQIMDKSTLKIVSKMKNSLKLSVETYDGKTLSFEIAGTENVLQIKKKIEEITKLACDYQKLIFNERNLEDCKTLNECHIIDKSIISLRKKEKIQIFITTFNRCAAVQMFSCESIIDLLNKFESKTGMRNCEKTFSYQGEFLDDVNRKIEEVGIQNNSVLSLL